MILTVLINVAFQKHRKILQKFEELPYVSLALDEGKTANYQNLHFVLESPFTDLPSYPFDTIRMEGGKAVHYVANIMKSFQSLNLTKIDIGTVVCDGNTEQKASTMIKDEVMEKQDMATSISFFIPNFLSYTALM